MKRIGSFSPILFGAVLIALTFTAAFGQNATNVAVVIQLTGQAEFLRGEGTWTKVTYGMPLNDGDRLRTSPDGFVALVFTDDRSQIKIRPNTEVKVNAARNPDYSLSKKVNMEVGELFAQVNRSKGTLQVASPTSVASVKGTEFWVIVSPNGETQVLTLEGLVELLNLLSGLMIDVNAGELGVSDLQGMLATEGFVAEQIPTIEGEEDAVPKTLEMFFEDGDGNQKRLIINYRTDQAEE